MEQKTTVTQGKTQREQMIQFIIKAIQGLDDKRLGIIYQFVLRIR